MCGITGFIDFTSSSSEELLVTCTGNLSHRGPDDSGHLFLQKEKYQLGLGHRRLSILDPSSAGHQPMRYQHLTIIFNGEIYNFKEVERELTKEGYSFTTGTDTEMILKAYDRWGMDCVQKFRGMWAFAIYDEKKQEVLLCRDRIGVKPLYYYWQNEVLLFASEPKSIYQHPAFHKSLDEAALSAFFHYGYIPAPKAIFQNLYKLRPAHFLKISLQKKTLEEKMYWDLASLIRHPAPIFASLPEEEVEQQLEQLLEESFQLRMVADVPVGMFLSGGIDSSLVAALLQKNHTQPIKTFTIGFDVPEFNEAPHAKAVANHLGTDHTEHYIRTSEAFDIITKLPDFFDEPFGDASAIPTYLVSKLSREQVTVSLSADGADEQFFGYDQYVKFHDREQNLYNSKVLNRIVTAAAAPGLLFFPQIQNLPFLSNTTKNKIYKGFKNFSSTSDAERFLLQVQTFIEPETKKLGLAPAGDTIFNELKGLGPMGTDMFISLPDDMLTKVDRCTMAVSLEGREPFLDHKLVEYATSLPLIYKYRNGVRKYLLRKILYKHVPQELLERPKQGFGVPLYDWFRKDMKELYQHYLDPQRLKQEGILNHRYVHHLVQDFFAGKPVNPNKIWYLFMFELWREKYM